MKVDQETIDQLKRDKEIKDLKNFIESNRIFSNYYKEVQEGKNPQKLGMWNTIQPVMQKYNEFCIVNPELVKMYNLYYEDKESNTP